MSRRAQLPVADLARRYKGGASLRELAEDYGVSTGTVRDRLTSAGVAVRRRGAPRLDVDVPALVYETHLSGSRRAAAAALGVGRATAARRLAELHC